MENNAKKMRTDDDLSNVAVTPELINKYFAAASAMQQHRQQQQHPQPPPLVRRPATSVTAATSASSSSSASMTPSELITRLSDMNSGKLSLLDKHGNYRYILERVLASFNIGSAASGSSLNVLDDDDENDDEAEFDDANLIDDDDDLNIPGAKIVYVNDEDGNGIPPKTNGISAAAN